jgi:hypothetical protein
VHFYLPGEPKAGKEAAFSPARKKELLDRIGEWARPQLKRPPMKAACRFLEPLLFDTERDLPQSTLETHIFRPVLNEIFPWNIGKKKRQ